MHTPGKVQIDHRLTNVKKKVDIHPVVVLRVFASLMDVEGKIIFDQRRIIKTQECQAINFFVVECLPDVVVEKNKPFHCNPFEVVVEKIKPFHCNSFRPV